MGLTFVILSEMSLAIGWIVIKFGKDIHSPLSMDILVWNFGDPLAFYQQHHKVDILIQQSNIHTHFTGRLTRCAEVKK